ncbi:MAG: hypothetical protein UT34_C0002G0220 [candidate division WS6 bacterium GW2011_GWF2_39_15]|uniref:Uncharacterized protein n=1 Tax=candidate division WS6 bacterium GW2011_GWF2_39_15 TaxID=1619100 RepID=A0A0G0MRE2_9BACT|nr:MAG: hypothetical protein UT34_C0002G0220 [candidate division WS6 bacterium GW2011_GWF2_39_15]
MRVKLPKVQNIFKILAASLITSVFISSILIALPQTERYFKKARYDLTLSPKIWRKEYTLELEFKARDLNKKDKKIEETKQIIESRLRKFGIENSEVKEIRHKDKNKATIKIEVESDEDQKIVDQLISQRYFLRFVTRKDGVNFDDTSNQFAIYDINNYENTPYTLHDFREVYVTKLKASTGEYSYFTIYKPWEYKAEKFYKSFDKLAGQYAGIAIDGFVSPIVVPVTAGNKTSGVTARNPFALGITSDPIEAKASSILLNSGVIPVNYTVKNSKELKVVSFTYDYSRAALLLIIINAIIYLMLSLLTKKGDLLTFVSYGLAAATFITLSKLLQIPLQPISLIYTAIILTFLMPFFINSPRISIILFLLASVLRLVSTDYIRGIASYIISVILLFIVITHITNYLRKLIHTVLR